MDDSTTPFSLSPARLRLCFDSIYCAVYTANLLIIVTHRARPETYASKANTRDGEREGGGGRYSLPSGVLPASFSVQLNC